jgi:anti-sigma factor RsiW
MKMLETKNMINCKTCQSHLPDLLLDDSYQAAHPELDAHLAACDACRTELQELRATYALLDAWPAPEPSAYFDSRLGARLREAEAARPEGLFERLYAFLTFSTGRQLRPALASALMLVLLLGGGTYAGIYEHDAHIAQPAATSPAVNDLRIMDNNAQALQQMDQLIDSSDDSGNQPST